MIEAAYRVDLEQRPWLDEIARTTQQVNRSALGALTVLYDARQPDWVVPLDSGSHGGLPAAFTEGLFSDQRSSADDQATLVRAYRTAGVVPLRSAPLPAVFAEAAFAILDHFGIGDVLCLNAVDPTYRGCLTLVPTPTLNLQPGTVQLWRRLAAHIAAGARLRRSLDELAKTEVAPADHAEAVITPTGRVDHATGPAMGDAARQSLQDSVVRVERARSRKPSPDEAVALWEALVAGRWSVVEHFERDGKRYYLAHRNEAELIADRALTTREQQVLAYAELGCSNKLIGYSLGLATSTVSTLLTSARRKLGVRDKGS